MTILPPFDHLVLALVIIAIAYTVRAIAGFGSGLIAIPFLAMFLPLHVTVILIALLDYMASLTHGLHGRQQVAWRLIFPLLPFNIIGVLLAVYIFQKADFTVLIKILAVLLFIYAFYYLLGLKPKQHANKVWAIPAGILGSLVGTLFGTGGPFYVIYLQLQGVDKSIFRSTIASVFLVDGFLRISSYFLSGFVTMKIVSLLLLAVPVMFVSLYVGEHMHTNISQRNFQRVIGSLLIVSSITLFIK